MKLSFLRINRVVVIVFEYIQIYSVMKKTLLIVVIILAVIIALPVINLIRWSVQSKKPMDIIIVDKTVPTLEREHHKSFNWILD